jgi:hypothetical protein
MEQNELDKYIGKKMKVRWWDGMRWYVGIVQNSAFGHILVCKELADKGIAGYLENAQEYEEVE